jgi:hypothetical protein
MRSIMQGLTGEGPQILWYGMDKDGYFKGLYRDHFRSISIAIAVPGEGDPPHRGPRFDIYFNGKKSASMPGLKAAQALAELHLLPADKRQAERNVLVELGLLPASPRRGMHR